MKPLRVRTVRDSTGRNEHNRKKRPKGRELEEALERSMPSYSPEHRRAVLKGLRILARVAIRSHMEEKAEAEASSRPEVVQDDSEEVG